MNSIDMLIDAFKESLEKHKIQLDAQYIISQLNHQVIAARDKPVPIDGKLYKLRTYGEWSEHDGVDHYECIDAELISYNEPVWWGLNTDWFHTRFERKDFLPINF
jgi:hypothetical protein